MRITYYGTGAGEAWPGVFCQCRVCREARQLGGKNIRTRSQALVNDDLLLDLPPDNQLHSLYFGLDLSRVKSLLFTHSHSDHCYLPDLEFLRRPFSHTHDDILEIYGNEAIEELLRREPGGLGSQEARYRYHTVPCHVPFETSGYRVLPLRARHAGNERCLFYRISRDGKNLLYAHDTGRFWPDCLEALEAQPGKLDLVSLDCTSQKHRDGAYHMGLRDVWEQKQELLERGLADENTIWVVNHFSHNGELLHEELEREAQKLGFLASYDGMTVEF